MTYGRAQGANHKRALGGAVVSHSAELVRGEFLFRNEGPLIRPSATFSPRGEGFLRRRLHVARHDSTSASALA
jgi:hypothetical protein